MANIEIKNKAGIKGRYRFIKTDSITGKVKEISEWIPNLIVSGSGTGINIIARILGADNTYPLAITKAKIGTGTNAPANSDTDLQTPTFTKNTVASQTVSSGTVTISFFLTTTELANGTYTEFGIFCVNQLFARSIISPSYVKGTNEDTTIEYEIDIANS